MHSFLLDKIQNHPDLVALDTEQQYTLTGISWSAYESLLADTQDGSGLRIHYLKGTLTLTMPGRSHEITKDNIARLLSVFFEETRTRFYGLGSTTFKSEAKRRGIEPDLSFCIGTDKALPDLAIEVIYTSGGVEKLDIYRGLGIPEVWFWEQQQLTLYHLCDQGYVAIAQSEVLPTLDLDLLATHIQNPEPLDAVINFRAALRETLP